MPRTLPTVDAMSASAKDVPLLEDQILHAFARSEFPVGWKQEYMPRNGLNGLITAESIIREFSGYEDDETPVEGDLIRYILDSAKKVFAISLISGVGSYGLLKAMRTFRASGFTDNELPATSTNTQFPWSRLKWSDVKKHNFKDNQWKFLVPVFRENQVRVKIGNRHILPFKLVNHEKKEGTFSDVWEVSIHESHQDNPMRMVCC